MNESVEKRPALKINFEEESGGWESAFVRSAFRRSFGGKGKISLSRVKRRRIDRRTPSN